jgi:tRNA(adenine34) deaminase
MSDHQHWMARALELAEQAQGQNEVPVGAVVVLNDEIIGEGWNQPISQQDPTAHAEIMALRNACKQVGNYRLPEADLYVTLEPCVMCAGALIHARIRNVYFATTEPKTGAAGSCIDVFRLPNINHRVGINQGVLAEASSDLLKSFFKARR